MQDFVDNILVTLQNVRGPYGGIIDVSEPVMISEMSRQARLACWDGATVSQSRINRGGVSW
jgi:hypothetical protein